MDKLIAAMLVTTSVLLIAATVANACDRQQGALCQQEYMTTVTHICPNSHDEASCVSQAGDRYIRCKMSAGCRAYLAPHDVPGTALLQAAGGHEAQEPENCMFKLVHTENTVLCVSPNGLSAGLSAKALHVEKLHENPLGGERSVPNEIAKRAVPREIVDGFKRLVPSF